MPRDGRGLRQDRDRGCLGLPAGLTGVRQLEGGQRFACDCGVFAMADCSILANMGQLQRMPANFAIKDHANRITLA